MGMGQRSIIQKLIATVRSTNQELQPIRHLAESSVKPNPASRGQGAEGYLALRKWNEEIFEVLSITESAKL